jgi:VWFA-related protein
MRHLRFKHRAFFTSALVVLSASLTSAQDTVIRINVNLVQVDAVVTDSKGQPVENLTANDFEVLQDGKAQKITNFAYIKTGHGVVAPPPKVAAIKNAPPPPPVKLKPEDVRRTLALVVDDLGISAENMVRIRSSLKKFVDQEMQPGDLVAIIRTGAGMGALQQFTSDKRMLYAAIERVKFNGLGRVGVSSFAPIGSGEGGALDEERNSIFTAGTLGAVRYVVEGLRELPGRKAVVLFSENIKLWGTEGMDQRVLDNIRHLTDAANRSSVVIYSIDPRGLQYYGLTAADNPGRMNPQQLAEIPLRRSQEVFNSQDGLVYLAEETGGLFMHDNNDIDGQLRQVVHDSEGYYLIGYHPDAATFDQKTGQPKFHKVAVRVKVTGLHARSRKGFFGTSDRDVMPVAHTRQAEIAHALASPFGTAGIHVRLTPLFTNTAKTGSYLNTMLYIDGKDLTFSDGTDSDGWHKAVIDVVVITFGDNGQAIDTSDKTFTIRAKDQTYESAVRDGLLYAVSHPVQKPGAYQMRVVVRDATSEKVGSASQFIEVPDVSKGRLTLSSLILREIDPAVVDGASHPGDHAEGQIESKNPEGSPAVRIFHGGARMFYGYLIMNATGDAAHAPELEVHTRLFRDGQLIYTGKPMPIKTEGQGDPKRLVSGGQMQLGQQIGKGDYVLQVIVTDKRAGEKYQQATQTMDFEIK